MKGIKQQAIQLIQALPDGATIDDIMIEEICNYIARDSEHYAALFAKKINAIVKNLVQFPKSGRVVPEYIDPNLLSYIFKVYVRLNIP